MSSSSDNYAPHLYNFIHCYKCKILGAVIDRKTDSVIYTWGKGRPKGPVWFSKNGNMIIDIFSSKVHVALSGKRRGSLREKKIKSKEGKRGENREKWEKSKNQQLNQPISIFMLSNKYVIEIRKPMCLDVDRYVVCVCWPRMWRKTLVVFARKDEAVSRQVQQM